jgi:hypothetical protein
MVISKSKKYLNRKMMGVSLNAAEQETVQFMMTSGGYTSFSQFAKAKIFGEMSENGKRLKDVETAIDNMRASIERNHNRWVDTAKRLSGTDTEPLMAATYALLHMMAKPQDRAVMAQDVDMNLVQMTLKGEGNGYRKA